MRGRLIVYACDTLQPHLPDDLLALIEQRVFVESDGARLRPIAPDVRIVTAYPAPRVSSSSALREGAGALVEPLVFELNELEVREGYLEIRQSDDGKVITVIEFLSPSNKRRGAGQDQYLHKQTEVLASDTSLVEIDLVRSGQRVLALPADSIAKPKLTINGFDPCPKAKTPDRAEDADDLTLRRMECGGAPLGRSCRR